MIAEIAAGVTAIARTKDLLEAVKSITDQAKRDVALFEIRDQIGILQDCLAGAREKIDSLSEEKRDLKKQLAEIDEWNAEKSKYQLTKIRDGLFLPSYTPSDGDPTPAHWACPNCFSRKHVSILQEIHSRTSDYSCPAKECGFVMSPKEIPPSAPDDNFPGFIAFT